MPEKVTSQSGGVPRNGTERLGVHRRHLSFPPFLAVSYQRHSLALPWRTEPFLGPLQNRFNRAFPCFYATPSAHTPVHTIANLHAWTSACTHMYLWPQSNTGTFQGPVPPEITNRFLGLCHPSLWKPSHSDCQAVGNLLQLLGTVETRNRLPKEQT